ncbi:hypothetical protein Tco_1457269 [Tanacetum coccineum]
MLFIMWGHLLIFIVMKKSSRSLRRFLFLLILVLHIKPSQSSQAKTLDQVYVPSTIDCALVLPELAKYAVKRVNGGNWENGRRGIVIDLTYKIWGLYGLTWTDFRIGL